MLRLEVKKSSVRFLRVQIYTKKIGGKANLIKKLVRLTFWKKPLFELFSTQLFINFAINWNVLRYKDTYVGDDVMPVWRTAVSFSLRQLHNTKS